MEKREELRCVVFGKTAVREKKSSIPFKNPLSNCLQFAKIMVNYKLSLGGHMPAGKEIY